MFKIETATPTPSGSWEIVIDGMVYDDSIGLDKPINDATINYIVLHSYFMELQDGRTNQTETDENGIFSLPVMVHDTDRVKIVVEAQGFISFEEKLIGVDLLVDRSYEIGLFPIVISNDNLP
jgi:hypothetical protein